MNSYSIFFHIIIIWVHCVKSICSWSSLFDLLYKHLLYLFNLFLSLATLLYERSSGLKHLLSIFTSLLTLLTPITFITIYNLLVSSSCYISEYCSLTLSAHLCQKGNLDFSHLWFRDCRDEVGIFVITKSYYRELALEASSSGYFRNKEQRM